MCAMLYHVSLELHLCGGWDFAEIGDQTFHGTL